MQGLKVFTDYFNELRYPSGLQNVERLGQEEANLLDDLRSKLRRYAIGEK
jgi:hypothetical protein